MFIHFYIKNLKCAGLPQSNNTFGTVSCEIKISRNVKLLSMGITLLNGFMANVCVWNDIMCMLATYKKDTFCDFIAVEQTSISLYLGITYTWA